MIWITGLSGAGKTSLANELSRCLRKTGLHPILLDGDVLRIIFNGTDTTNEVYSRELRINLALKYAQICHALSSQGFTVVISTISMFEEIYSWNRKNFPNYFEVYLKVPLKELFLRDPKKIYQRYKDGKITNVAGLDLLIDEPSAPHLTFDFESHPSLWKSTTNLAEHLMLELGKSDMLL